MKQQVKIYKIKGNPKNPRIVKDYNFKKLVNSIKNFPQMMEKRPLIVDENYMILGGNMRWKACQELKMKEIWIDDAEDWTEEQKNEFIIKDNVGSGEWDWDLLANEYSNEELKDWGLDVWQPDEDINLDDFFEEDKSEPAEETNKIVLEYSKEDYEIIIKKFTSLGGSKERVVWESLGL